MSPDPRSGWRDRPATIVRVADDDQDEAPRPEAGVVEESDELDLGDLDASDEPETEPEPDVGQEPGEPEPGP
jgi:hypothetical protein